MSRELPFAIEAHLTDRRGVCQYVALVDGEPVDIVRYTPGDTDKRRKAAESWRQNSALHNGQLLTTKEISNALAVVEANARNDIEAALEQQEDDETVAIETASYVDDDLIVELAWNSESNSPDFVVYERSSCGVERCETVEIKAGLLVPPRCCRGVVTPGGHIAGNVLLPTERDEAGLDEDKLREDIRAFIDRYVDLPNNATSLAVEYALLSWVFDGFDEVPYLAFRTADAGRGKSRALETVGALCYRPILCGGGSTAAATLRLLHTFTGTLVADEYDQRDSELGSELTKLINQGFQTNRPLVRCDGEGNQPKAFRCFGPKLFALRKGFADDATETRIISVRMKQRGRESVPISLPRRRFDNEALRLRNRLLGWRFARLGQIRIDLAHADSRVEDRYNQIGLPLMAVAGTAEGRARIVEALIEQQQIIAADRSDSLGGETFEAVLALAKEDGVARPGDVARFINERRAMRAGIEVEKLGRRTVNPWKIGRVLGGDLELCRGKRDEGGARYVLDSVRRKQLCQRFGLDPPVTSETSKRQSSAETSPEKLLFGAENAHSDVPDDTDVSITDVGPDDGSTPF